MFRVATAQEIEQRIAGYESERAALSAKARRGDALGRRGSKALTREERDRFSRLGRAIDQARDELKVARRSEAQGITYAESARISELARQKSAKEDYRRQARQTQTITAYQEQRRLSGPPGGRSSFRQKDTSTIELAPGVEYGQSPLTGRGFLITSQGIPSARQQAAINAYKAGLVTTGRARQQETIYATIAPSTIRQVTGFQAGPDTSAPGNVLFVEQRQKALSLETGTIDKLRLAERKVAEKTTMRLLPASSSFATDEFRERLGQNVLRATPAVSVLGYVQGRRAGEVKRFVGDIGIGGYQDIRQRPLTNVALFAAGGVVGSAAKGLQGAAVTSRAARFGYGAFQVGGAALGTAWVAGTTAEAIQAPRPGLVVGREATRGLSFGLGYAYGVGREIRFQGLVERYGRAPAARPGRPNIRVWGERPQRVIIESDYGPVEIIDTTRAPKASLDVFTESARPSPKTEFALESLGKRGSARLITETVPSRPSFEYGGKGTATSGAGGYDFIRRPRFGNISRVTPYIGIGYGGALSPQQSQIPSQRPSFAFQQPQATAQRPGFRFDYSPLTALTSTQATTPALVTGAGVGLAALTIPALLPGGGASSATRTLTPERPPATTTGFGFGPGYGFFGRGRKEPAGTGRGFGYAPSWEAIELGIFGKSGQRVFTGAEIRPLLGKPTRRRRKRRR